MSVAARLAILLLISSCCASAQQDLLVPATWGAIAGAPYHADLTYRRAISAMVTQGSLPPGLALSASGEIAGTPLGAGQFSFAVQASFPQKRISHTYLIIVSPKGADYGPRTKLVAKSGKPLRSCQREPLSAGDYSFSGDIAGEEDSVCLRLSQGVHLDLGGFILRGRLSVSGNPTGVEIGNGSIHCRWRDDGANAGCIRVSGEGAGAEPLLIRDLEITNAAEEGRALHIDWPAAELVRRPSILLEHLRVRVPAQPTVARSYALSVIAKNQFVVASSNDLTCSGRARACQAMMCYGIGQCKVHHNRFVMEQNTTDETGRAILFDGHTQFGEAWNNEVVANNNRAVRIRDSRNIRVHDNTFSAITTGQNGLGVLHLGDPDGSEPNDLQASVDENAFFSSGGVILFARGAINFRLTNNIIECSPKCPPYALARVRGPIRSELIFSHNQLIEVEEPSISLDPNTKVVICDSGRAAGPGMAVEQCSSRPKR